VRRRTALASSLVLGAVLLGPPASDAKPRLAGTFDLTGTPEDIARGPDGNMWVTLSGGGNSLAKIEPGGGVTEYDPAAIGTPEGITTGQDGNLWVTQANEVVSVPPADPNSADDFSINSIGAPQAITKGPEGKLWTASGDQLISFLPANPAGFEDDTIDGMGARGITSSGGRLWIADFTGQRIVKVAPAGGIKEYDVGGGPQQVAKGPDGGIGYANPGATPQRVGRIEAGGKPRNTRVPMSDPFGMAFAPDRDFWFAQFAKDKLGRLSLGGDLKGFRLPDNSGPRDVAVGPNNRLWVTLETSEKIARIKGVSR
jgi:streptogramin lyase